MVVTCYQTDESVWELEFLIRLLSGVARHIDENDNGSVC